MSLPKGPGSIEGLGRAFTPSLASGTASYGVEITVPPGALDFAPKLSLDYESATGLSDLGIGWRLSGIPSIRRSTQNGLPTFTSADTLEAAGFGGAASDLVKLDDGSYRFEHESGSFVRAKPTADGWEARDKAGITYRFGGEKGTEGEGDHVATWLLRSQTDLNGHQIRYEWEPRDGHGELQKVVYNEHGADVQCVVAFTYEDSPDPHVSFAAGIRQGFKRRLKTIEVTQGGHLVRRYIVGYRPGRRSLVQTVDLVGRDGTSRMPTLTLGYTGVRLAADGQVTAMTQSPGRSPADPNVEIVDLNGDGLPDLLHTRTGQYRSYLNHDGAAWKPSVEWTSSPSAELASSGVQLADLDGDGAVDLVIKTGMSSFRYLPGDTATRFAAPVTVATVPNVTFEDPDVRLVDMDGDRRTDVLITGPSGISIGYNLNGVDWKQPQLVGQVDPAQPLRFSDGHTQLCDMNGDGVSDLCFLRSGSLLYWTGRGRGKFEASARATGVPTWEASSPWELRDLDGDGWPDLVHLSSSEVDYALATGEGTFGERKTIHNVPERGPQGVVRFADMNGNGTTDIVWIDVTAAPEKAWRYLDIFPDGREGLLKTIDNGLGKVTSIVYGAAAKDAARARDAGQPWTTRMNLAMSVIRSIETDVGLGDPIQRAELSYRNGTWSKKDRTFAGFSGGIDTQRGDAFTPTLLQENTYDVGADDRTRRGLLLTSEQRDETGRVFSRQRFDYTSRTLAKAQGRSVNYTFRSAEETLHFEGAPAPRRTLTEWDEDAFGNVTSERRWGEVSGQNKRFGNDEAITIRTFATDTDAWVLGRLSSEELRDGASHRVRLRRVYYDGPSFVGLPLGQVTKGNVSREEEWVGPDPDVFELKAATSYDLEGHPIETRDARGGTHVLVWDPRDHTSLKSESVKTATETFTTTVSVDPAFGSIAGVTGFGGDSTKYTYDAFGRLEKIIRPGDSDAQPTARYTYREGHPLSRVISEKRITSGHDEVERTEAISDGAARQRATFTPLADGRIVQSATSFFDARGNAHKIVRDRWATTADVANPPLHPTGPAKDFWRDATGRTVRERTPLGMETRMVYEPLVTKRWDGAQSKNEAPYEGTPHVTEMDGLGRIVGEAFTLAGVPVRVAYTRDAAGALLTRTDPDGNVSRYGYDGRGRRMTVDDPDAGKHRFIFDATGNATTHVSPTGTRQYTFDLLGRELTQDWDNDGHPEVVRTWDRSAKEPNNPIYRGKLAKVVDPSGSSEHAYDERGRLRRKWHTIDGETYEIGLGYDAQDRKRRHEYPDGSSTDIELDARGLVTGYTGAVTIHYDADAVETDRVFATGAKVVFGYDNDRRRHDVVVSSAAGAIVQSLEWQYDGANNLRKVTDRRAGIEASRDRTEDYVYDNLYRLIQTTGSWGNTSWDYSRSGNLKKRLSTVPELNIGITSYGANAGPHAITGYGTGRLVHYDAGGHMRNDGDRSYTWNGADQLVRIESAQGAVTESVFDGDGIRRLRKEKAANGTARTTIFLDDWTEVENGKLNRYITHAGRRILKWGESLTPPSSNAPPTVRRDGGGCSQSGEVPFGFVGVIAGLLALLALRVSGRLRHLRGATLLVLVVVSAICCGRPKTESLEAPQPALRKLASTDTLLFDDLVGSLTEVSNGAGETQASFAAYPFGNTRRDTTAETRRYASTPRDVAAGVDQMGARSYVSGLGFFSSVDPVLVEDPERAVGQPFAAANGYAYAALTPAIASDESGRWTEWFVEKWNAFRSWSNDLVAGPRFRSGYEGATRPEYQQVKTNPVLHATDLILRATPSAAENMFLLMAGGAPKLRLPALSSYARMNQALSILGAEEAATARSLRFSQTTASSGFSAEGSFAGQTIGGLATDLRAGTVAASEVPVSYVNLGGNNLIVNTRSSLALTRAGIPQTSWRLIDVTATEAAAIESRLLRNGLKLEGTSTLRITGAGKAASCLE